MKLAKLQEKFKEKERQLLSKDDQLQKLEEKYRK